MPSRLAWRDLIPGLVGIALVALATWAVLVFARVGAVRGETIEIHAATESGRGVVPGSPVWVAGHEAGQVRRVSFAPPGTDTLRRLVLTLEVARDAAWALRRDATLQIRPGGSPIAAPVAYITPGTAAAPPLAPGDTIGVTGAGGEFTPRVGVDQLAGRVPELLVEGRAALATLRIGAGELQARRGAMSEAMAEARDVAASVRQLRTRLDEGDGARARRRATLAADRLAARLDTLERLVADTGGTVGALLQEDGTLRRRIAAVREDARRLAARARDPYVGTTGRLLADSALRAQRRRLDDEVEALLRDLRRRPLRYVNGVRW